MIFHMDAPAIRPALFQMAERRWREMLKLLRERLWKPRSEFLTLQPH